MTILVVRHGYDDFDAGESSIGRRQILDACVGLEKCIENPKESLVLHSGTYRAKESALIASDRLGINHVEQVSWLGEQASDMASRELGIFIDAHPQIETLLVFTHLPVIQDLLSTHAAEFDSHCHPDIGYASAFIINTQEKLVRQIDQ